MSSTQTRGHLQELRSASDLCPSYGDTVLRAERIHSAFWHLPLGGKTVTPQHPSLILGFQTSIPGSTVLPKPAPKSRPHIHHAQGPLSDFPSSFSGHENKAFILTSQALLNTWISSQGWAIWGSLSWKFMESALPRSCPQTLQALC